MNPLIYIDGSLHKDRYLILINREPVLLQGAIFKLLTMLSLQLMSPRDVFLSKYDFCNRDYWLLSKYIYRLKKQIHEVAPHWEVCHNNKHGGYKLATRAYCVSFNIKKIKEFGDMNINKMIKECEDESWF